MTITIWINIDMISRFNNNNSTRIMLNGHNVPSSSPLLSLVVRAYY